MLAIKELFVRNFKSFGDYDTTIKLDGVGPVLIVGEIPIEGESGFADSNGSGKTTLIDALIWCLFGRLPNKAAPGDHIVNWETGKNCIVKIVTKDGYIIQRTRKLEGHNDLTIHTPEGNDITDSVNQNAQQHLNKLFNLDYDIFMSSVFFTQKGKPFLEQSDNKRKKALERMLNLTKYDFYADAAKEKLTAVEAQQFKHKVECEQLERDTLKISSQIEDTHKSKAQHELQRQSRISETQHKFNELDDIYSNKHKELSIKLDNCKNELANILTYDIKALEKEWLIYEQKLNVVSQENNKIIKLKEELSTLKTENEFLSNVESIDYSSRAKSLKVRHDEVKNKINSLILIDVDELRKQWDVFNNEYKHIESARNESQESLQHWQDDKAKLVWNKDAANQKLEQWLKRDGKACPECEQQVETKHVKSKTCALESDIVKFSDSIIEIESKIKILRVEILSNQTKLVEMKAHQPNDINMAEMNNKQHESANNELERIKSEVMQLTVEKKNNIEKQKQRFERIKQIDIDIKLKITEIQEQEYTINAQRKRVESSKPSITISEAKLTHKQYETKLSEISFVDDTIANLHQHKKKDKQNITDEINRISHEANPYDKLIQQLDNDLITSKNAYTDSKLKLTQFDTIIKHISYIYKAYSDRKKIKAFTVHKMIPYLNERLSHYLKTLRCDFPMKFNDFLQAETGTYPYELWSGGECRRIDIALMLAIYRLNNAIHGQQCNVLVFDEVERSLDKSGRDAFIDIILREFTDKSVLLISHTTDLIDAFPTKIIIKRADRYNSKIEEVR